MALIDAHCHFWRLDRGDYGWLAGEGGPLAPIRRDFGPGDYPGPGSVIAVQAAPSLVETEYLLGLAATDARILGVVGWADLTAPEAGPPRDPKLVGIRPMLQDIAATDWLLDAPHPAALAALVRQGLVFDALVTERHLSVLARFAAENPELRIVIDHGAKPQPGDRTGWEEGMRALAANRSIHCKLSGLLTELSPEGLADPLATLTPIVARLLDWFGPERLIWGSDWPVLTLAAPYADWGALTEALLDGLSAAERAAILGGNAARFYGVAA